MWGRNGFLRDSRGRNAHTIGRRWWKGPGLSAHGHGGRELSHLAEAVTQRVRRVADRDREHRRAVFLVVEVGVVRLHRRSPAHSRTDQRRGEHLTDIALLD